MRIRRTPSTLLRAVCAGALLTTLSGLSPSARADEFTVGRSGADVAYNQSGLNGAGVTVAVVDSGIRYCSDLTNGFGMTRIVASTNLIPGDYNTDDLCGHGTHVAGIIGGNGNSSKINCYRTFYGIARGVNLVSVKVLNAQGTGSVSTVIAGIQWCIANKSKYNIKVMSLSLGHPVGESYATDPLCQAVEAAYRAGISVVCAAGNDGRLSASQSAAAGNEGWGTNYGSIQSPGNDPFVITVGAMKNADGTRSHDRVATYSSRGPTAPRLRSQARPCGPRKQSDLQLRVQQLAVQVFHSHQQRPARETPTRTRSGRETPRITSFFRGRRWRLRWCRARRRFCFRSIRPSLPTPSKPGS